MRASLYQAKRNRADQYQDGSGTGSAAVLQVLHAEMQALANVLPGVWHMAGDIGDDRRDDAQGGAEDGDLFDNLPV